MPSKILALTTTRLSIIIWGALVVHIIQAISMIYSPLGNGAIDVASILQWVPLNYAPAVMISTSGLAFVGLIDNDNSWYFRLLLFLPQQGLITAAAFGAISASLHGAYFDGTVKAGIHIFNDQLWLIMYFVIHAISVVRRAIA